MNLKEKTKQDGIFVRNKKNNEREVQNIEHAELNKHLADFICFVRHKNGEDYEPSRWSLQMINKNLNLRMYKIGRAHV